MKNIIFFLIITVCNAQLTLNHNGLVREYYVSYPEGVTEPCPLIINMHGFGSNALEQQFYSGMNPYALVSNMAVVYPKGINNSWNVGTFWDNNEFDDIGFISALIDSVAEDFNIDLDRVYACGMSNGGYMAYELACELSHKIAAFGSVTGNFMLNDNQECDDVREIPILHAHGTLDYIVPYDYSIDGSLYIDESTAYWRAHNDLTYESIETIPDINTTDNSYVEKFTYYNDSSATEFVHFRVYGGGHQWFGSIIADWVISQLGNNNHDININEELVNFFLNYKLSDFIVTDMSTASNVEIPNGYILYQNYPNPFNPATTIAYNIPANATVNITIYDMIGRRIKTLIKNEQATGYRTVVWDGCNDAGLPVSPGLYLYTIKAGNYVQTKKMVLLK